MRTSVTLVCLVPKTLSQFHATYLVPWVQFVSYSILACSSCVMLLMLIVQLLPTKATAECHRGNKSQTHTHTCRVFRLRSRLAKTQTCGRRNQKDGFRFQLSTQVIDQANRTLKAKTSGDCHLVLVKQVLTMCI